MSSFDQAIAYLLKNEKGFVDNPNDSGGPTNFGITMHMLSFYRANGVTADDVKNMSVDEAKLVYKKFYWDFMKLESLPLFVSTSLFDMAVNMGQGEAVKLAQKACSLQVDGILGPQTVNSLMNAKDYEFIFNYVSEIQDHYTDIVFFNPKEIVFLKGWLRRALRLFHLIEVS